MSMMDAIGQAQQAEKAGRLPFVVPTDFWTDYIINADGSRRPIDYVRWVKKGQQNPSSIDCSIPRMPKFYADVWEVIKPYYDKWKEGQAAPVIGTPLAAWPGATPQLVKALEPVNIKSVEDFSAMEDSAVSRLAMPGLREKIVQAKAFLQAQANTAGISAELVKLRDRIAYLEGENKQLRAGQEDEGEPEQPAPAHDGPPMVVPTGVPRRKGGWPKGKPRKPALPPTVNPDNDGTRVA